jgi:hypothetical protein
MRLALIVIMIMGVFLFVSVWEFLFMPAMRKLQEKDSGIFSQLMGSYRWNDFDSTSWAMTGPVKMIYFSPIFYRFFRLILFNKATIHSFRRKTFLTGLLLSFLMTIGGLSGFAYVSS